MEFHELEADFTRFTRDIAYCVLTTVDRLGRPRSRLMHPMFEVVDGQPRGWALTDRTPVKSRHLSANPHVSCFYWSPAHNTVSIDCVAAWVDDREVKSSVWKLFSQPPPVGWGELTGYEPQQVDHPQFHVLELAAWRVQILRATQMESGDFTPATWTA